MKTTAWQATASVQLCRGHDHDHDREIGLCLSQPWRRLLLRWWRLELGREALGFVFERDDERRPFFIVRREAGER
jgi:hypothetical protein